MPTKQLSKFLVMKIAFIGLFLFSIFEGIIIMRLSKERNFIEESRKRCWNRYEKSMRLHQYSIKVVNYDRDLNDVVLKYRTFADKTILIGDLPALDITLTDSEKKEANRNAYSVTLTIDDMVSPMFFEISGRRKDGTVFEGSIPPGGYREDYIGGFDIYHEYGPFEVFIYKDREELSYR